ncbi:MAG: type I-MYXAN CRISPR-associated Cas8a1/Cmx1 [Cyanobacteria bacterium NC_groundwater_1444_Ag_S-0.65um_54_12]|nr:type I-MYXAN CRISPR-associated Cas8a1/Cmx1 [Cyanobacteria bacterium NC_groundwater_1444_Ag_S-0.65um_54_12]
MGKTSIKSEQELCIQLGDPAMTPLLRSGLGGLAAALRCLLLKQNPAAAWPATIPLGPGYADVTREGVVLRWEDGSPEPILKDLFQKTFQLDNGVIDIAGTYAPGQQLPLEVASALQSALRMTFLQHGQMARKAGEPEVIIIYIDDNPISINLQRYKWYKQQDGWQYVLVALNKSGHKEVAAWASPGAVVRHEAFKAATSWTLDAKQLLCACFAPVGTISLNVRRGQCGILVIPEPKDLLEFAKLRTLVTPKRLEETYVAGLGDAVLAIECAIRTGDLDNRNGVQRVHGVLTRATAWSPQQKSVVAAIRTEHFSDDTLNLYYRVSRKLPSRIKHTDIEKVNKKESIFVTSSELRGLIADNLARNRLWYANFGTAKTGGKKPRYIHQFRLKDNLGALWHEEREGLISMLEQLETAEQALVNSIHIAIRKRLGAIANETKDNSQVMKNRWRKEREKWRLAFFGAKTSDQLRAALADLWSRAGSNLVLQEQWPSVLPLLRPDHWQLTKDLALVALASYKGDHTAEENVGDAVGEITEAIV